MPGCPGELRLSLVLRALDRGQNPRSLDVFTCPHERFRDSDMFRRVFERVVGTCIAAGLVGGEGFAVDASLIQADANKHRPIPGAEWNKEIHPEPARSAVE